MAQAGYDPRAMIGVMQVLADANKGQRQPEFMATHPHPEARLQKIKEHLTRNYPDGIPEALTQGRPLNFDQPVRYR